MVSLSVLSNPNMKESAAMNTAIWGLNIYIASPASMHDCTWKSITRGGTKILLMLIKRGMIMIFSW